MLYSKPAYFLHFKLYTYCVMTYEYYKNIIIILHCYFVQDKDLPRDIDVISCSDDDTNINYDSDKYPEYVPVDLQDNNASVLSDVENVSLVSDIVSNCQNCKNKFNYNLIL